ncbi:MAG: hypothetical protein Ta2E_04370 [Mycoplasmoidaceae bacterium]|nr:MAG: hypothetical protein Ta2E_04370 [Mycoplasmoidaceae bacterium]
MRLKKILTPILVLIWLLYFCFTLTSCVDNQQIYDSMLPNFLIICVHTVSTIILIIVSIWLVWNPTKKAMENRRKSMEKTLNDAEANKKESFARLLEAEEKRLSSYEEAQSIIDKATNDASFKFNSIVDDAQSDAAKIIENAKRDALVMKDKVSIDNDKKISEIAFATAEEIIKRNMNSKDNELLVKNFIKSINKGGDN